MAADGVAAAISTSTTITTSTAATTIKAAIVTTLVRATLAPAIVTGNTVRSIAEEHRIQTVQRLIDSVGTRVETPCRTGKPARANNWAARAGIFQASAVQA